MSDPNWHGKKVLVTGASGELGTAIVTALVEAGAQVTAATRRKPPPIEAHRHVTADLGNEAAVKAAFDGAGPIDVFVHAAGVGLFAALEQTALQDWEHLLRVNLTGTFLCLREALIRMKPQGGRIVVVGSVSGVTPLPSNGAYGATKAGIRMLCGVLNEEGYPHRVLATHLAVGAVASSLFAQLKLGGSKASLLSPEDVAQAVLSVGALPLNVRVDEMTVLPAAGIVR